MGFFNSFITTLLISTTFALLGNSVPQPQCLSDPEAEGIAKRWLAIWDTGYLKSKSQLTSLVTRDILSFDGTYGPPTVGINSLYDSATYVDPLVTNVIQYPEWVFHSCNQIAVRWGYSGVSTGVNSSVPAGTHIYLEGIEILLVNLKSRLISNATSSADWALLATQLGEVVNL